jgi:type VI secretion system protein ImpJ
VPAAVPVRPDTYYFSLSTKSGLYDNVLKAGAIAIYARIECANSRLN